jgi:hypothetical protein
MPRGVKGSGKAAPARVARNGSSDALRADEELEAFGPPARADNVPCCRIPGCGAMLAPGGQCPACTFRAKKYAKVFEIHNPNCECGAPRRPKKPGATRMPRRCPLCAKLRAKAVAKGIAV